MMMNRDKPPHFGKSMGTLGIIRLVVAAMAELLCFCHEEFFNWEWNHCPERLYLDVEDVEDVQIQGGDIYRSHLSQTQQEA